MPRPPRVQLPGAVYHVTNRSQGRQPLFADAADARRFMALLEETAAQLGWRLQAYCLMTDRYHFVLETPRPNLSTGMQALAGRYTQAFNRRHGRDGPLFRGRFHTLIVERETALVPLVRYVVLAPVLAGLAKDPAAWRWSSYRATAGMAPTPALIDLSWLTVAFGLSAPAAQEAWRADIARSMAEPEAVRAIEPRLMHRSILGSPDFVRQTRRAMRKRPLESGQRPKRPRHNRPERPTLPGAGG